MGGLLCPVGDEDDAGALITALSTYKKVKKAKITVVFDGGGGGRLTRDREVKKSIEIIYSRPGEEADRVIIEMATKGDGLTIISSDREIQHAAERSGAVVMGSDEFASLLLMASDMELGEEDDSGPGPEAWGKKKGPARRSSKKERRKEKVLKKL